jgi:hypothetical protein
MTKTCKKCGEEKPVASFYLTSRGGGLNPECKPCNNDRSRSWLRAKRLEDPEYSRWLDLWCKYRLRREDFEAMLARQGGACAACGATEPGGKGRFNVDHDHACCPGDKSCGQCVRGLLCAGCNSGIGFFNDDVDRLMAAAAYLLAQRNVLGAIH